jgi:hypothetical protein
VTAIHDLIEDWIKMRSAFQQQIKLFESGEMGVGSSAMGAESAIRRIKKCVDELNGLLKEHANADRP